MPIKFTTNQRQQNTIAVAIVVKKNSPALGLSIDLLNAGPLCSTIKQQLIKNALFVVYMSAVDWTALLSSPLTVSPSRCLIQQRPE